MVRLYGPFLTNAAMIDSLVINLVTKIPQDSLPESQAGRLVICGEKLTNPVQMSLLQQPAMSWSSCVSAASSIISTSSMHLLIHGPAAAASVASLRVASWCRTWQTLPCPPLFDRIPKPDVFTNNRHIIAYSNCSCPQEALCLHDVLPNEFTLPFVLKACARALAERHALATHTAAGCSAGRKCRDDRRVRVGWRDREEGSEACTLLREMRRQGVLADEFTTRQPDSRLRERGKS
jgi:hypothetical protein